MRVWCVGFSRVSPACYYHLHGMQGAPFCLLSPVSCPPTVLTLVSKLNHMVIHAACHVSFRGPTNHVIWLPKVMQAADSMRCRCRGPPIEVSACSCSAWPLAHFYTLMSVLPMLSLGLPIATVACPITMSLPGSTSIISVPHAACPPWACPRKDDLAGCHAEDQQPTTKRLDTLEKHAKRECPHAK